jgi:hypothetical protein
MAKKEVKGDFRLLTVDLVPLEWVENMYPGGVTGWTLQDKPEDEEIEEAPKE